MTPLAVKELEWWHGEFNRFRRQVKILITVGFALILLGFGVIAASYLTGQEDIHRVSCANSQALVTQFEWLSSLATINQNHLLTAAQVRERQVFYDQAEHLAVERSGDTCATLGAMRSQAMKDIAVAFKSGQ